MPVTKEKINGRTELNIVTRNLGIVWHDLTNLKLYGGSKPELSKERAYDLVVMTSDFVERVPKTGFRLIGKPLDKDYRVRLKWNDDENHYDLVDLSPAKQAPAKKPAANEHRHGQVQ